MIDFIAQDVYFQNLPIGIFKLEPNDTEVELATTFRVIVLPTAKMELSHNNY